MPDLDALAPNYRRAQQRWSDAPTLAKCYEALGTSFAGDAHGMVELVKAFVESVCLTIMGEHREQMPSSTPSTTDLLVAALKPLGLRNTKGASKLDKVLTGFNKLADALTEMRNDSGPVAHGRDAFLDPVSADHARAFVHAGDAILGVLLNALEGKQPDLTVTREPYGSFPQLDERIDHAVSVGAWIDDGGDRPLVVVSVAMGSRSEAIELRIEPSRLLYGVDREAYVEVLRTAELPTAEEEEEPVAVPVAEETPIAKPTHAGESTGPVVEYAAEYTGALGALRSGAEAFLRAEALNPTAADAHEMRFVDSLLRTSEQNAGLDWRQREPLQARVKVACKRVLLHFGAATDVAEKVAGHWVAWLRIQAAGDDGDESGVT